MICIEFHHVLGINPRLIFDGEESKNGPRRFIKTLKPALVAGFKKLSGPDGTRTRDLRRDRATF